MFKKKKVRICLLNNALRACRQVEILKMLECQIMPTSGTLLMEKKKIKLNSRTSLKQIFWFPFLVLLHLNHHIASIGTLGSS